MHSCTTFHRLINIYYKLLISMVFFFVGSMLLVRSCVNIFSLSFALLTHPPSRQFQLFIYGKVPILHKELKEFDKQIYGKKKHVRKRGNRKWWRRRNTEAKWRERVEGKKWVKLAVKCTKMIKHATQRRAQRVSWIFW